MRIAIIGSSGSGKSTLARSLSARLGMPWIELDAVNWRPGWRQLAVDDPDAFTAQITAAIAADSWVTDGNYRLAMGEILRRATDLVWLDYSRWVVMSRVMRRSALRSLSGKELWPGTGNREDWRRWINKDHPIRWAWDTFKSRRERYETLFADPRLARLRLHRLRHPGQAIALMDELAQLQKETPL